MKQIKLCLVMLSLIITNSQAIEHGVYYCSDEETDKILYLKETGFFKLGNDGYIRGKWVDNDSEALLTLANTRQAIQIFTLTQKSKNKFTLNLGKSFLSYDNCKKVDRDSLKKSQKQKIVPKEKKDLKVVKNKKISKNLINQEEKWRKAGFRMKDANYYIKTETTITQAKKWKKAGFNAKNANYYIRNKFTIAEAISRLH